jgi:uracil-DNA glycosylase
VAVVQPRIVVVMGERALATLNRLELPLASVIEPRLGEIQRFTPTIDALHVPDIDESLDSQQAKQGFWRALRPLGDWYADQPPY